MYPRPRRRCATRWRPLTPAWARSRTETGWKWSITKNIFHGCAPRAALEGWIEQRYLVDQKTYDAIQKLTQDNQADPVQAPGILRNDTNMHVTPGRETEHLYQLTAGAKVSILKRATAEKQLSASAPAAPSKLVPSRPGANAPAGPVLEDWWLVRDSQSRVGWVLSRMVDVDAPLDVAQYAEGQRIVAVFVLNEVPDTDKGVQKKVAQYLCIVTEPHDGLPYDFDQLRVFTWNTKKAPLRDCLP